MSDIHSRIKRRRLELGLSMEVLAKAADLKSWQAVQQWENGTTAPKRKRLEKVATALKTSSEYLLSGSGSKAGKGSAFRVNEPPANSYVHPNPQIAKVVALLERTTDVGIGEVLRAAKEAAREHAVPAQKVAS